MEEVKHIFIILVISNILQVVTCEADEFAGLVAASTVTGILLCLVIIMAVLFAVWRDSYNKRQLQKGRIKVPRSWLDHERLARLAKKERIKQHIKEQIKQKNAEKAKQNGGVDMEMQYLHRSRPQIPGSWRREVRHPNGYIVKEVPTLQRTVLVENQQLKPVMVEVSDSDHALWQRSPSGIRYSQLTNASTGIPVLLRSDRERSYSSSSSASTNSTIRVNEKKKFKSSPNDKDEVIEATIDFTNDGAIGEDKELQERVTAF